MPDGKFESMTFEEAFKLDIPDIREQINQILDRLKNRRRVKDGFTPGWQENIGEYAGGPREYQRLLKEKGLVEIGYDYVPRESTLNINPCANEEFVKAAFEAGVQLTGSEVEAIKSGEYFKSDTPESTEYIPEKINYKGE